MRIARLPLLYGIADVNAKTKGVFQPALLIWESAVTGRKSAAVIAKLEGIVKHLDIPTSLTEFGVCLLYTS